jgi:hypothetical protein
MPELAWCPTGPDPSGSADRPEVPAHVGGVQWPPGGVAEHEVPRPGKESSCGNATTWTRTP